MRSANSHWWTAALVLLLCLGSVASAQSVTPEKKSAAKRYFKQATEHFNAGRYDEAIVGYQAAYGLTSFPDMLFDIGQSYRLKGDGKQAVEFYRRYLADKPDGEFAPVAREHIAALAPKEVAPSVVTPTVVTPTVVVPTPVEKVTPPVLVPTPEVPPPVAPSVTSPATPAVTIVPPAAEPVAAPARPLVRRPAFWGILAAGVVVVAGGVTLSVLLSTPRYGSPPTDLDAIKVGQ